MGKFYATYRDAINCTLAVGFIFVLQISFLVFMQSNAPRCWHEKKVVEWHGSFYEIIIHSPDCPETTP